MTLAEVEKLIRSVYLLSDPGVIKLLAAAVISHRLLADPVWCFIVGPSSGGKTELITALSEVKGIYPISSLTANTFISGQKRLGKETSLLLKLTNHIISIKDFTTLLTTHKDTREEIMGQLREIYDGAYKKDFGTGDAVDWKGKVGLIAGVTTVIYIAKQLYSAMGERFVMYHLIQPDREAGTERAMDNADTIREKRQEIKIAFKEYLDNTVKIPERLPPLDPHLKAELIQLAEFSTRARSPIERDWRSSSKEMTFVHDPEMPFRFAMQLTTLAQALRVIDGGELNDTSRNILYKITLDSIDKQRRMCLQELTRYEKVETAGLATKLNYPTTSVRRWLEDLNALQLIDRIKSGKADKWEIKPEYRKLMEKFEGIEMLNYELVEGGMNVPQETENIFIG